MGGTKVPGAHEDHVERLDAPYSKGRCQPLHHPIIVAVMSLWHRYRLFSELCHSKVQKKKPNPLKGWSQYMN